MTRYLLYSEDYGIYLGSFLGMGFWSSLDSAGQDEAITFESEKFAINFMKTWESQVPDVKIIPIEIREGNWYATIEQCVAIGLPAWNPEI